MCAQQGLSIWIRRIIISAKAKFTVDENIHEEQRQGSV